MKSIFTSVAITTLRKCLMLFATMFMVVLTAQAHGLNLNTTYSDTLPQMAINLLYTNAGVDVLADGVLNAYDPSFHVGVGDEDAEKMMTPGEDISIINTGIQLSLDARPLPQNLDTLFLQLVNLTKPQYTLQIFTMAVQNTTMRPYLIDRYLGTTQALMVTDTNRIVFNVIPSVPASFSPSRFIILFRQISILPITFNSINADEINTRVNVQWLVTQEGTFLNYDVERSANGIQFSKVGSVTATSNNHSVENYSWVDKKPNPGINYYRIRVIESDGKSQISKVVQVSIKPVNPQLIVYPNPVRDDKITLKAAYLVDGNYRLQLFNSAGQSVITTIINHPAGALNCTILTGLNLANGIYTLRVSNDQNGYSQNISVLVQK